MDPAEEQTLSGPFVVIAIDIYLLDPYVRESVQNEGTTLNSAGCYLYSPFMSPVL